MIRGILRKILKPVLGKRHAAKAAEDLDRLAVKELDRRTYGAVSKLDELIK